MQLRLAVTPDLEGTSDAGTVNLFSALGDTLFRPTLVDVEHLKEYSVVQTAQGQPWLSRELDTKGPDGAPMLAYAWFTAPEDDISSIDVRITGFWPAFTDVPITR